MLLLHLGLLLRVYRFSYRLRRKAKTAAKGHSKLSVHPIANSIAGQHTGIEIAYLFFISLRRRALSHIYWRLKLPPRMRRCKIGITRTNKNPWLPFCFMRWIWFVSLMEQKVNFHPWFLKQQQFGRTETEQHKPVFLMRLWKRRPMNLICFIQDVWLFFSTTQPPTKQKTRESRGEWTVRHYQ